MERSFRKRESQDDGKDIGKYQGILLCIEKELWKIAETSMN